MWHDIEFNHLGLLINYINLHNIEVNLLNYLSWNVTMSNNIKDNHIINLLESQCDRIENPTFTIAHHLHRMVFTKITYV